MQRLSNSTLSMLRGDHACRRCFYDHVKLKIERPRGAFPSIPGGIDREVKLYADEYRGRMPPLLGEPTSGLGRPPSGAKLWGTEAEIKKLRHWASGLKAQVDGFEIIGAFDDLVVHPEGTFSPLDFKSRGAEPEEHDARWYQSQVDIYALLLDRNGMQPSGHGYLWYWFPRAGPSEQPVAFGTSVIVMSADWERAVELIVEAKAVLTYDRPPLGKTCEWCLYRGAMPAPPCSETPGPVIVPGAA